VTRRRHSPLFLAVVGTVAVLFFFIFVALGTWQVHRRAWKLDLIARVDQRVQAPPVAAPGPAQWSSVSAATDEYRHVTATGTFLDDSQTLVQAVTALGAGYWVITPLRLADGNIVLVNRGFVGLDDRDRVRPAAANAPDAPSASVSAARDATVAGDSTRRAGVVGETTHVTGLLRITEPGGAFLRHNDPAANRWYSRDVQAIASARGLTHVAPYFIDAEAALAASAPAAAAPEAPEARASGTVAPVGGLTVITFHNSHLIYAITWYTLALMTAGAIWVGVRNETRT
jgi:surfeit locus 1 family protein